MHQRRKLEIVHIPYSTEVSKVLMAADAVVLGVEASPDGIELALSIPDPKTNIDRLVWMVRPGHEVPSGAHDAEAVGLIRYARASATQPDAVELEIMAVFVETQTQSLLRPSNSRR